MSDQGSGAPKTPFSAFALPSVALLIVSTIGYLAYQPPLKSSRPTDVPASDLPQPPSSNQYPVGAVYARMWEDPLGVCYRDPNGDDIGAIWKDGAYDKIVRDASESKTANEKLLVMPVFLPGSPSGEDLETRKRTRYAVLAALSNAAYELRLNDRMSYVKIPVTRVFETLDSADVQNESPLLIPTKLYRLKTLDGKSETSVAQNEKYSSVLVCWINQNQLGDRPLEVIDQIYSRLFSPAFREKRFISIAILGPRGSNALQVMLQDKQAQWAAMSQVCETCKVRQNLTPLFGSASDTTVYSPTATARYADLLPLGKPPDSSTSNEGIRLVRTIGTDERLVKLIIQELGYRQIKPNKDRIVLVTERDTLYGRSINNIFEENHFQVDEYTYLRGADGRTHHYHTAEENGSQLAKDELKAGMEYPRGASQLDYLRRLESQLVDKDERRRRNGEGEIRAIGVVGTDFYDKLLVLRALRKRFPRAWFFTTDMDAGFLHPDELGHTQNLLVASHFGLTLHPDLQGSVPPFRDSYQTSMFFATMLALKHLDEMKYDTKAKTGVLDLKDPWNCNEDDSKSEHLKPLMFEIGRHLAYQLTQTKNDSGRGDRVSAVAAVHPQSPRELSVGFWGITGRLLAVLLFVFCLAYFDSRTRGVIHFFFYRPLTLFAALPEHYRKKLENSTKAVALRLDRMWESWLFSGMKSGVKVFFLQVGIIDPEAESNSIDRSVEEERNNTNRTESPLSQWLDRFGAELRKSHEEAYGHLTAIVALVATVILGVLLLLIWIDHSAIAGEPFSLFDGISVWPSVLLRVLVVLAGSTAFIMILRWLEGSQKHFQDIFFASEIDHETTRISITRLERVFPWKWHLGLKQREDESKSSRGERIDSSRSRSAQQLFREYKLLGTERLRLFRVVLLTFSYIAFGWIVFNAFGWPNSPTRGWWCSQITWISMLAAVFVMIGVLMLMLDAAQLARFFIRALGKESLFSVSGDSVPASHPWKTLPADEVRAWFTIQAIGKHTKVIGNAVWWPAGLVLLIAMSRLSYFDGWDMPWALVALITINLLAVIYGGLILRKSAQDTRRDILTFLRRRLNVCLSSNETHEIPRVRQLQRMIAEIENADEGAFRPLSQDPFLWALTVPFGGAGGLLFLERTLNM